jgi:hypothetical protein
VVFPLFYPTLTQLVTNSMHSKEALRSECSIGQTTILRNNRLPSPFDVKETIQSAGDIGYNSRRLPSSLDAQTGPGHVRTGNWSDQKPAEALPPLK